MQQNYTPAEFQTAIYTYFQDFGRSFEWRENIDPYFVVVSEIMLQQTQTDRVKEKFREFIHAFPTINNLAQAPFKQVLQVWQGLGYNRRALYLYDFAQKIVLEYDSIIPDDPEILKQFKGIGPNTAASICAFAFNKPVVFIETNIRSVFIHFFFGNQEKVSDKELLPLIAQALDTQNPRKWYYALMDYGVMLKKQYNPSRKSTHYAKQSKFEGSDRQIRGQILKILTQHEQLSNTALIKLINKDKKRVNALLEQLIQEKLIIMHNKRYMIS
jgi:A/G-specific adenine glycosylase